MQDRNNSQIKNIVVTKEEGKGGGEIRDKEIILLCYKQTVPSCLI